MATNPFTTTWSAVAVDDTFRVITDVGRFVNFDGVPRDYESLQDAYEVAYALNAHNQEMSRAWRRSERPY